MDWTFDKDNICKMRYDDRVVQKDIAVMSIYSVLRLTSSPGRPAHADHVDH